MTTIRDLKQKVFEVRQRSKLFGSTEEFSTEFKRRLDEIGEALGYEHDISMDQANYLPDVVELGPKSTPLFVALCEWVDK